MKIATYNINGINARLPVLLEWLKEARPDIVCLQELKSPDDKIPKKAILDAGYNALWHGQKRWNGVAILARDMEIRELERGLPGDPEDEQSRYLEAVVDEMVIGCIYLPNGNPAPGPKLDYKLKWFERLTTRAAELIEYEAPAILLGDFNVMPTELDTYKPEKYRKDALFLPEVREAFHNLTAQGWRDAIRELYPEREIYTFYDYFRNAYKRNAGLRIDHFLLSSSLDRKLLSGGVDKHVRGWEKTSDHCPVWIELEEK